MKKRSKEKLSFKEFLKRWKKGIKDINPYQQAKITYQSNWLLLIGIIGGLIISLMSFKSLWWLALMLSASLILTILQQIANYQKLDFLMKAYE